MHVIPRSKIVSTRSVLLTIGMIGIALSGAACAHGAKSDRINENNPSMPTSNTDEPSNGVMDSRMAPTQTTTGTGRNPDANSIDRESNSNTNRQSMSGEGQSPGDDSTLPRMAPTQSTQGTGNQPAAGSGS